MDNEQSILVYYYIIILAPGKVDNYKVCPLVFVKYSVIYLFSFYSKAISYAFFFPRLGPTSRME